MRIQSVLNLLFLVLVNCVSYGPMTATSVNLKGNEHGESCKSWVLHPHLPFTWGRNDIMAAATNGRIQQIAVVDTSSLSYLVYGQNCTHVYGVK